MKITLSLIVITFLIFCNLALIANAAWAKVECVKDQDCAHRGDEYLCVEGECKRENKKNNLDTILYGNIKNIGFS